MLKKAQAIGLSNLAWPADGYDRSEAYQIGRGVLHFYKCLGSGPDAYSVTVLGVERSCGYCLGVADALERLGYRDASGER